MGSHHRGKGVPGSNSSSDGKRKWADFIGVRDRGVTVEVKKWHESVNFYKDVKMPKMGAALAHDFARVYSDPDYAEEGLNIHKVVVCIQQELDPELASLMPLNIGKSWLDDYVSERPLKYARKEWGSLKKEQKDELKDEIVGRAPAFLRVLQEKIACEHSRAGRQRKDLDEILPLVLENDVQGLNKEILDLRAIIREKDAEIATLKEAYDAAQKARDAAQKGRDIVSEELCAVKQAARAASVTQFKAGVAEREESLQTKEIQELKAIIRAKDSESELKDAEIASLKEAKDAAIEARNIALEAREMAWYTGIQLASQTPCNESFRSLDAFLQDDDWMDSTVLDNHCQRAFN